MKTKPLLLLLSISCATFSEDYSRGKFKHWVDEDKDCQTTRSEMLQSGSIVDVFGDSKKGVICRPNYGLWYDPYSGDFVLESSKLDLDHIVPLKWAWEHGASLWDSDTRERFANDPDNLVLTIARWNRQKGAKGLADWLPPRVGYQCEYIVRFLLVVRKYGLSGGDLSFLGSCFGKNYNVIGEVNGF